MANGPTSIEIREFQVGFGDSFLLSFVYAPDDKRHVLIDFGTTELPKSLRPSVHMPELAREIGEICGGQLTAVVATHRHADHISGFGTDDRTGASGEIISNLKPKVVLQPWTEDPEAAEDATTPTRTSKRSRKSFVSALGAMHEVAASIAALASARPAWMSAALAKQLRFLGMENIRNESAVTNLIAMGSRPGATAVWAHHGSRSGLERLLPGVKVKVLGPPTLKQSEKIRSMRSTDPDEFWHLLAGVAGDVVGAAASRSRSFGGADVPVEARWFRERLDRMQGEQLLEIVRTLDSQMNNTSVILLFEAFGKKLLFPGDAQIENWSYALEDAPDAAETRALLAGVDVYKVGHHGSLNATPKELLWKGFKKRSDGSLQALLSTLPGKHGKASNNTEVPRRPLLDALRAETHLLNTNDLAPAARFHLLTIEP